MNDFHAGAFLTAVGYAAAAIALALVLTFLTARIVKRHNVIDTTWGLLYVVIAVVAFAASAGDGDDLRRVLLLALPTIWGVRLAQHVGRRSMGKGEDERYNDLLDKAPGNRELYAVRIIYLLQGLLALVVGAPILVGMFEPQPVRTIGWIGVAVWSVGVFFEAVGDVQMQRFRDDPANRGKVIDVGLWRYTRHPNYFGDACVWWGIFLVAADALPGPVTVFAPIVMTLLLVQGSGVRILEKHMSRRAGWAEYAARTSRFFPRPPRKPVTD